MSRGRLLRGQLRGWSSALLIGSVGLLEAVLFAAGAQLLPAVLAFFGLGLLAWAVSPAAFPRSTPDAHRSSDAGTVVYWRPGCVYCLRLRWRLGRLGRRAAWVDIWTDEQAMAFVRESNDGNATVPTVVVDGTVRTNPEVEWVRRALQRD